MLRAKAIGLSLVVVVIVIVATIVARLSLQPAATTASTAAGDTTPIMPKVLASIHPSIEPQTPQGVPAIHPTQPNKMPAFTYDDVQKFVTTSPMPKNIARQSEITIARMACMLTSKDISQLLRGASLGLPTNVSLCYVELQGTFIFGGPPSHRQPSGRTVTFRRGFEVFDAKTGDLLANGGIGQGMPR